MRCAVVLSAVSALSVAVLLGSAQADTHETFAFPLKCSGNEPFWSLSLDEREAGLSWMGDDGGQPLAHLGSGERLDYLRPSRLIWRGRAAGGNRDLVLALRAESCIDTMSGRVSPVQLLGSASDGQVLIGCCRPQLVPSISTLDDLSDRNWLLTHINQQPATHTVTLQVSTDQLEEVRFVGSTSCNRYFTGVKSSAGNTLRAGDVGLTRRACREPSMAQLEQHYVATLKQINQWQLTEAGELVLTDGGDNILRYIESGEPVE